MRRILLTVIFLLAIGMFASAAKKDGCDVCWAAQTQAFAACTASGGSLAQCQATADAALCSCSIMAGCGDGITIGCITGSGGPN